jgi:hypothetical protein
VQISTGGAVAFQNMGAPANSKYGNITFDSGGVWRLSNLTDVGTPYDAIQITSHAGSALPGSVNFPGLASFATGTAAAPQLAIGNSTTGFYSVSTTGFGISVNGTSVLDYGISTSGYWTAPYITASTTLAGYSLNITNSAIFASSYNFINVANASFQAQSLGQFLWTNSSNAVSGAIDTGLSRDSANVIDVGNGTQGNKSGTLNLGNMVATAAAPTVSSARIGYGSTVAAATSCGSLTLAAGCVVINVAGTPRYIPYY